MIDIDLYLKQLTILLSRQFESRLVYVGLQGSYLRGEANENSDIDVMVVIDGLSTGDLSSYRSIINSLPHSERSCGFICSKADLGNWNPLEIHHLIHSTKDYYGTLSEHVPSYTKQDIRNFIKLSVNNLYHEICHRYIHADLTHNAVSLPHTYKGVFFILQNLYALAHDEFVATKAELLERIDGNDRAVLTRCLELSRGIEHDFEESFSLLFTWCQETLSSL